MKNEAKWHIQSLQALFEDRVCLLREQKQGGKNDGAVLRAQRQMGSDVSEVKHVVPRLFSCEHYLTP